MSTNDAVFSRRNKQIQDAIDGQNLKQALQLIDKRMKKGENTKFLKAWKAHILYRHADQSHRQRGIKETLDLCKAEPPATDLDTLDILYQTLKRMGDQAETMRTLWEKAAKAKPQDLDLQLRWFTYAFEGDDWKSAQKAAMTLQSNFPKTRKYYLWAIFLSHLVATDQASSETDRKLFGTLAYRMVSKAAESVPSDPKELLSLPRAIQGPEELLLLVKIFESQGRYDEIVKILDSENLGLSSRVIQNDWSFVGVKLSSLEKAEMWTQGLSYARDLLAIIPTNETERKSLQEHDDWAVWKLLVISTRNINSQETIADTLKFISDFLESVPKSRNAQLARLDLIHSDVLAGNSKTEELVSACQEYFDCNKNKLYCFSDLQLYMAALDKESVSKFVEYTFKGQEQSVRADPFKGVATINALKLEYCFVLSANETNASKSRVEDFISRCLQVYREAERPERSSAPSTIESQPSDDLCLLVAMVLIRFSGDWNSGSQDQIPHTTLIRAAAILERLLLDSPHNYQALLLLVRIYLRLGAGSLALKAFSKLSVKQMQFETVAHNLFTRLATIHPHSAPPIEGAEYKDFDPRAAFVQALNFYRSAELTTVRHRSNGLELGSYVNIEGTIDLQRRLKYSICRRMWALDARRMQRLAGGDSMNRYEEVARDSSPLSDQRVFDAFMNCEPDNQPTFEERMRLGPLPRSQWVKSARVTDELFGTLKDMAVQKPVSVDADLLSLEDIVGPDASSEMTSTEIESAKINLNLLKVVSFLNGSTSVTPEEVDSCLTQVEEWLGSKLEGLDQRGPQISTLVSNTAISLRRDESSAPSWKSFHDLYLSLESLKALSLITSIALKKASKTPKLPKDRVQRLAESTHKVHESIRVNARALKSAISKPGVLGSLIDLVVTGHDEDGTQLREELDKTFDLAALEMFCGELMESWEEGLNGLLCVSL
ncbi:N-acetyltransferase B complex non catalytic subunit-domain-containing protein [Aspergillus alliaceus]|uniref:N-acetyltransferase B complex non catalytic subunit-domain-containing protein n=1 Tax=Petromyces alliaceus TaxID=209559 RepID=A0A5N7CK25_PETAA|nr:N-acetyltransferase B complex non catalytic subunit-domain-containing protein [Aspergillus alliaceus]